MNLSLAALLAALAEEEKPKDVQQFRPLMTQGGGSTTVVQSAGLDAFQTDAFQNDTFQ